LLNPKVFNFQSFSICEHDSAKGWITRTSGCDLIPLDPAHIFGDPDYHTSGVSNAVFLSPNDTIFYLVYLNPAQKGIRTGYIIFTSSVSRDSIPLTATVTDGTRILSASPNTVDLGSVSLCDYKDTSVLITLENTGCDTLTITNTNFSGSGFSSNQNYPIIILPGQSKQIAVSTNADTSGGKTSSTATLTVESNSDNTISPVILKREYTNSSSSRNVGFYLDPTPKSGGDQKSVSFDIKETPSQPFAGANLQQISFDLNYNTDLLTFDQTLSSPNVSFDGQHYYISANPITATNGVLGSLGFRVYLTKDSVTAMNMTYRSFTAGTASTPCSTLSVGGNGSAEFNYAFVCGERSIQGFLNGILPMKIISLRPNPAQEEIEVEVESPNGHMQCAPTIYDALGVKVYSSDEIVSGVTTLHLDTRALPSGVYLLRIGSASQPFVKAR
jgi:hypothetical protein